MDIIVNKSPMHENDSYLFKIKNFRITDFESINDPYVKLKRSKFKAQDISKDGFESFLEERGSLRFFNSLDSLPGSIYTYSIQERQNLSYEQVIQSVKDILENNKDSRRAVLSMANPIIEYKKAELSSYDVSCLNLIHYLNNKTNLVFRSSDIQYELFADIITIYEFFLMPIYKNNEIDLEIYGSTAQKINYFDTLIIKLAELK